MCGSSLSTIIAHTDDNDAVFEVVKANAIEAAWVSPPSKGFVCVFGANRKFDFSANSIHPIQGPVLHAVVLQEDVFRYQAFENGLGETFSRAMQVFNHGSQKRGVDIMIEGTAIESGIIAPDVKIGKSSLKLDRTSDGALIQSLPQKTIASWFACEFSFKKFTSRCQDLAKFKTHNDFVDRNEGSRKCRSKALNTDSKIHTNIRLRPPIHRVTFSSTLITY